MNASTTTLHVVICQQLMLYRIQSSHSGGCVGNRRFGGNRAAVAHLCSDWLRAGRQRSRSSSQSRVKNFHFSVSSRPELGSTQPPIQCVLGALSPVVKRQEREADHSSPTSAEVKKT
jgi:hypothetical protein